MRCVAVMGLLLALTLGAPTIAETVVLNDGWMFRLGDQPGAEQTDFDDHDWRRVSVPHDWSIEDRPGQAHPFDPNAPAQADTGYMTGGVGWYRRVVVLPADVASKTVLLRFEGVYMDAEIWVNGQSVGRHPYGYTAFILDISSQGKSGANTIAVRVDHQEPSSRWYPGSGIIRPVRLEVLDKVHIDPWGPAISTPAVSSDRAEVQAKTTVVNARSEPVKAVLASIVLGGDGREVQRGETERAIPPRAAESFHQSMRLSIPALWSVDTPNLYTLVQEVRVGGALMDSRRTRFGVRSLSFDAKTGLLLNGERVLLKGGAIHHDNYMIGAAGIPRADERKLELMKAAGYNAVRSAHNPASQATLDAADRLGMLVIDEAFDMWSVGKRKNDYSRFFKDNWRADVSSMIWSGRNHPSIIMWSLGNEIPNLADETGRAEAKALADLVHQLDPTRPTTAAVHLFVKNTETFFEILDVAGYNYRPENYSSDHAAFLKRVMYGSESFSAQAFDYWAPTETMPWVIGDFVWTAVDYLGEASIGWTGFKGYDIGPYPWHLAMAGEIDATGRLRPAAYYREVLWRTGLTPTSAFVEWPGAEGSLPDKTINGPTALRSWVQPDLHPSWNGFDSAVDAMPVKVVTFSENEELELLVNGKSIGRKPVSKATEYKAEFFIRYEPGTLKAVGYVRGKPASEWVIETAGRPEAVRLSVDRGRIAGDGDDLAYVTAQLVDAQGRPTYIRKDDRRLAFEVHGAGVLVGVGNGDPVALESFQSGARLTFHGRAVAVVRATRAPGSAVVDVTGPDLPPTSVTIAVE